MDAPETGGARRSGHPSRTGPRRVRGRRGRPPRTVPRAVTRCGALDRSGGPPELLPEGLRAFWGPALARGRAGVGGGERGWAGRAGVGGHRSTFISRPFVRLRGADPSRFPGRIHRSGGSSPSTVESFSISGKDSPRPLPDCVEGRILPAPEPSPSHSPSPPLPLPSHSLRCSPFRSPLPHSLRHPAPRRSPEAGAGQAGPFRPAGVNRPWTSPAFAGGSGPGSGR